MPGSDAGDAVISSGSAVRVRSESVRNSNEKKALKLVTVCRSRQMAASFPEVLSSVKSEFWLGLHLVLLQRHGTEAEWVSVLTQDTGS